MPGFRKIDLCRLVMRKQELAAVVQSGDVQLSYSQREALLRELLRTTIYDIPGISKEFELQIGPSKISFRRRAINGASPGLRPSGMNTIFPSSPQRSKTKIEGSPSCKALITAFAD